MICQMTAQFPACVQIERHGNPHRRAEPRVRKGNCEMREPHLESPEGTRLLCKGWGHVRCGKCYHDYWIAEFTEVCPKCSETGEFYRHTAEQERLMIEESDIADKVNQVWWHRDAHNIDSASGCWPITNPLDYRNTKRLAAYERRRAHYLKTNLGYPLSAEERK